MVLRMTSENGPKHDEPISQTSPEPSQTNIVIRWIAFVPAAFLGCIIGRFLIVIINRWGMSDYLEPGSFMWRVVDQYLSGLMFGAIFVYVGSYVAPMHKKAVAVFCAGFVLVLAGFLLFPSILVGQYWAILEILFMGIGACSVAYRIFTDDIRFLS